MIKKLEIKNYKNLQNLEIPEIKQINLITGKNGIGKTNLLKYIYENDYFNNYYNIKTLPINKITDFNYSILSKNEIKLNFIEYLKIINNKIENIIYDSKFPIFIKLKDIEEKIHINKLGNGFLNFLHLILTIYNNKNANVIILIDNIFDEIHYSLYEQIWQLLLNIAQKNSVQIFATTHSYEMIKAFNNVSLQNKNDNYFNYIELFENINKQKIDANVLDSNRLKFQLDNKKPIRGEYIESKNINLFVYQEDEVTGFELLDNDKILTSIINLTKFDYFTYKEDENIHIYFKVEEKYIILEEEDIDTLELPYQGKGIYYFVKSMEIHCDIIKN